MSNNTDKSDINEIMLGYYLNGKKWFSQDAKRKYEEKRDKVTVEEHDAQAGRAQAMDAEFRQWAKSKGYSQIKKVSWVARPGALQEAVGKGIEVDSDKNPTDILVHFTRGPADGLLGISAKSAGARGTSTLAFKNPGLGQIEKMLKIDNLTPLMNKKIRKAINLFGLSEIRARRKVEIVNNKKIQEKINEMGSELQSEITDALLKVYKNMKQSDLRRHLIRDWMNASKIYPPYVKVTGKGTQPPYMATVEDVLKNDRISALNNNDIRVAKTANETIAVTAGGRHIMKIRAKFESVKLASSCKFIGETWP